MKYICSCGTESLVSEKKFRVRPEIFCPQCQDMTFWTAIEWPQDIPLEAEIWFNGDTYWYSKENGVCFYCKINRTNWVSLSFEGHLCTPVCAESAWNEYMGGLN